MSIQDLINFIYSLGISATIFPTEFPTNHKGEAMLIETSQSFNSRGSVYDGTFIVTVRAEHPERAEELSLELIDKLRLITNASVGDMQVIQLKAQQVIPSYLGKDNSGKHYYYQNNFTVLLT